MARGRLTDEQADAVAAALDNAATTIEAAIQCSANGKLRTANPTKV